MKSERYRNMEDILANTERISHTDRITVPNEYPQTTTIQREFQTTTTSYEEEVIAHRKFRERIDRLAHPQMCYICQKSYTGITVVNTDTGPMCERCKKEVRSRSYEKCRKGDKWLPLKETTIVRVFPRYSSILACENEKYVEFCWTEMVLYKPFREFQIDISQTSEDIIQNWENFQYNPWHIDHNPIPPYEEVESEDEEDAFPKKSYVPFGGRSIILVGDSGQLPLVMDKPIYACDGQVKVLWNSNSQRL